MRLIRRIKKWLFSKLLRNNLEVKKSNTILNINGDISIERCNGAFEYLKLMVEEIEPKLKDKIHLYIIDVKEHNEGLWYIIDDIHKCRTYEFNSCFCSELYDILCKDNKCSVKDNSCFLNLESAEAIVSLVDNIIKSVRNAQNTDINSCPYYQFSKIKVGRAKDSPRFVRFYGIGCDEADITGNEKICIYELFESMLNECIGYIESPTDRNVMNTFKIREEYASKILKKYDVIADSELITEIAATRYESAECIGGILFHSNEGKRSKPLIQFNEIALDSKNMRIIRKYLEMSRNGYCLWAKKREDEYYIYGMDKREKAQDYILLQFTGYRKWLIQGKDNNVLLERKGEKYSIPDIEKMDCDVKQSLKSLLFAVHSDILCYNNDNVNRLMAIVRSAKMQQHGTMIIFAPLEEAKILTDYFCEKNRGIKLERKVKLTDKAETQKLLLNLSAIDGALIIDTNGCCHAVGVILDGIANEKCNMARGARYNSALTFITNENFEGIYGFEREKCKVFVFSEDKTINILPDEI